MSVRQMAIVWARSKQSGTALLLLLAIADFANDEGFAWPSIPTLGKKIRLTERSTQRLIERLEASDELKTWHGQGPIPVSTPGGIQRTNLYQVVVEGRAVASPPLSSSQGGDSPDAKGVTPASPNPSVEPSGPSPRSSRSLVLPLPTRETSAGSVKIGREGYEMPAALRENWKRLFQAIDVEWHLREIFTYWKSRPKQAARTRNWQRRIYNRLVVKNEQALARGKTRPLAVTDPAARAKEIAEGIRRGGGMNL